MTALRVLQGYNALDDATLVRALADADAMVRVQAIRLASANPKLVTALPQLSNDASAAVRYELLWALASLSSNEKSAALLKIASRDG